MLNLRKGTTSPSEAGRGGHNNSSSAYQEDVDYDDEDENDDNDYIDHEEMIKDAYFKN